MNRKMTFDKEEKDITKKTILWKVIGFDIERGILIIKNTMTGEWSGRYMSTGAVITFKDDHCLPIYNWGRDDDGKQIEEIKKIYKFIEPPPEKHSHHHEETCGCQDCKKRREILEILNQKENDNDR